MLNTKLGRILSLSSLAIGILISSSPAAYSATSGADIDAALKQAWKGEPARAIARLERVLADHFHDRLGDRAALALGNLLIKQRRHQDALEPLRRASDGRVGTEYAGLLMARTIIKGGLQEYFQQAEARAKELADADPDLVSSPVRQEAAFLMVKLRWVQRSLNQAISRGRSFADQWPKSDKLHEVRWITAEALRKAKRLREAHAAYETIWYGTPRSPWAKEARDNSRRLEEATAIRPRRLSVSAHFKFIKALRGAGLHLEALEYVEDFRRQYPSDSRIHEALYLEVRSLHILKKRDRECVETVEHMRRDYRLSKWLPSAAIYAIKCLRRSNDEVAIRRWADWIVTNYPGHSRSWEALFSLGVFLGNVVDKDESLRVLRRVIREGGKHRLVDDAYWYTAWTLRRQGRTTEAVKVLKELLERIPGTEFRAGALYWVARFTQDRDPAQAIQYFRICLKEFPNDYYGHQSRENLRSLGVNIRKVGSSKPFPRIDFLDDPSRRDDDAYSRAANLKSVGLYEFAAKELLTVPGVEKDTQLQFALAELHSRSGDPWGAIDLVRKHFWSFSVLGSRDPDVVPVEFWHILYPFNYRAEIAKAIREAELESTNIDPYLVAALIRMESRFFTLAVSPRGAIGLMQVMPDTAEKIAAGRGLPAPTRADLHRYDTNIRYGVSHLAQLVKEFRGDWLSALCSYHAGSDAAREWWSNRPKDQPQDEFIENILFPATRSYIKQILGDYRNYEWIYSQGS